MQSLASLVSVYGRTARDFTGKTVVTACWIGLAICENALLDRKDLNGIRMGVAARGVRRNRHSDLIPFGNLIFPQGDEAMLEAGLLPHVDRFRD
jgi:hypothetical protein